MNYSRRRFQSGLLAASSIGLPQFLKAEAERPQAPHGVASGFTSKGAPVIWSRCDRPATMWVETSEGPLFGTPKRFRGPAALPENDFCTTLVIPAHVEFTHYRVRYESLVHPGRMSGETVGTLNVQPRADRPLRLVWSGDTAGQGYGIGEGGMTTYKAMNARSPDLFVHSGDMIYADNPLVAEKKVDGGVWKNVVTEAKSKVAETQAEFWGNFQYNLMDEHVREFHAGVPILAQWDDHEVTNNWYPGELLDDDRYTVKSASLLAARARKAFFDYLPVAGSKIHRRIPYGPQLDLFFLDLRSFRGPNSPNRQATRSPETDFMGRRQLTWLQQALRESKATWKIICSDMPIGLLVRDGEHFENGANGDGPPLGRELEFAKLLSGMKRDGVKNVVWLTADVHYATSVHYHPDRAQFKDFDPFWEFVTGPIHAGPFGPGELDPTFGPKVEWASRKKGDPMGGPPTDENQFFGQIDIEKDGAMTVVQADRSGTDRWTKRIEPEKT